tara:strand:+ start:1024 stop:1251 length:228 start_codon:yes stop_codon:yes gene_type:complete
MLNYKSMLGDSHYTFIKDIKGANLLSFAKYESYTFSHYYIISHVSINQSKKRVVSSLNVFTKKIDHKVESLADAI